MTPHVLPPLPYAYSALQPWIDEHTLRVHHDYHHLSCVVQLNALEERLAAAWQSADFALIRHLQRQVAAYAAEHFLHSLFWDSMGPKQGGRPHEELADQIAEDFGSFATFKSRFSAAAISLETNGWVVLTWQPKKQQFAILTVEHQPLQIEWESTTLLALDVWEHAYYLKYQHRRAEYVHNWWNTVSWPRVCARFVASTQAHSHALAERRGRRSREARRYRYVPSTSADRFTHSCPVVAEHAVRPS